MTRSVRGSSKASPQIDGRYSRLMSITVRSMSTMVTFSIDLCFSTSSSMPPSPPPMISTLRAAPWASTGTWASIS
jgi:hypothetical protein